MINFLLGALVGGVVMMIAMACIFMAKEKKEMTEKLLINDDKSNNSEIKSNNEIEGMTHEEAYQRYKEKKRQCKTIAQEVELITSDPEMMMLRERLERDNAEKSRRTN